MKADDEDEAEMPIEPKPTREPGLLRGRMEIADDFNAPLLVSLQTMFETAPCEHVHHVDRDDRVLGRVSRAEAHARGLLHRSGCVIVRDRGGRIFLARRARSKAIFAGAWDWPCSFHVSWGESYEEAAARELVEETGLRGELRELGTVVVDEDPDHLIVRAYLLVHDGPLQLDPAEAESGSFLEPEQIERILEAEPATSWLRPTWRLLVL